MSFAKKVKENYRTFPKAYPERTRGVGLPEPGLRQKTDAAAFIRGLLRRHGEFDG